jgi:glyoxylase-like metal-dependent hydrolase (beta-lactamase superfamily II)
MEQLADGLALVSLRTPTLAPATHTNTWVVGRGALTVFDPASPYPEEQEHLLELLDERRASGERVARIVLTHHHHDHVGGAVALARALGVPIAAHETTASLLRDKVPVDETIAEGELLSCGGRTLRARFTPGHAPGHLVFQDLDAGWVVAGDLVAGVGTILIDPRDGELGAYLDSLERVRQDRPTTLLPAHGPALPQGDAVLSFYIAHRHQRTEQIRAALRAVGAASPAELVPAVYAELPESAHEVAAVQISAHLLWLERHGLVTRLDADRFAVSG